MGIKEIALKAGVSQTTVSLALNGHKGVSAKTRNLILEIAENMEYRVPTQRSYTYPSEGVIIFAKVSKHGLILNKDQNVFILDYIDGINPIITNAGYTFEIFDQQIKDINDFVEFMNNKNPNGLIFLGTEHDDEDIQQLSNLKMPYLVMDAYFDFIDTQFIDMNNSQGVYDIVKYLIDAGHKNISMVSSARATSNLRMRENYFKSYLDKFKLNPEEPIIAVSPGFEGAYQDIRKWLTNKKTLPDALFCYNDVAAYGVIKALKEQGIMVPDDISIIGFDNLPTSAMIEPHLTTIAVPNKRIGEIAGRSILDKIGSLKDKETTAVLVSVELIIRDSVKRNNKLEETKDE